MSKYRICDRCGSNLDYGETCDCEGDSSKDFPAERVINENKKELSK